MASTDLAKILQACIEHGQRIASASSGISSVQKEECCMCFNTAESQGGLFLDLVSLISFCPECAAWNHEKTAHPLYLRIVSSPAAKNDPPAGHQDEGQERPLKKPTTRLADGMAVALSLKDAEPERDFSYSIVLMPELAEAVYPCEALPERINAAIAAVIAAEGKQRQQQVQEWVAGSNRGVARSALTLKQLDNGVRIPPSGWRCAECGLTQNLWLNLTDGTILCGRSNWDGSGGNGHAMAHYRATKYPLAVKLGTITRDLENADVFSYEEDDAVEDPLLAEHLRHFGIDFSSMAKTEQTTAERELDQNLSFEWNRVEERGVQLRPVFGPGLTGLRNLGNSCYLASVMQVLFSTDPFITRYFRSVSLRQAFQAAPANPTTDLHAQLVKLGHGLLSGRYSKPEREACGESGEGSTSPPGEQKGIPPRMLKHVVGRSHPEFSTARQQDAFEFLQYLFEMLHSAESARRAAEQGDGAAEGGLGAGAAPPSRAFEFRVEEKIRCGASGRVGLRLREDNVLSLPVPLEAAVPRDKEGAACGDVQQREEQRQVDAGAAKPSSGTAAEGASTVRPRVPLSACLRAFEEPDVILNFFSTAVGANTTAYKTTRFVTFPEYLVLHLRKYVLDEASWTPRKLDVLVDVPHTLDLSHLRALGQLLPGEQPLPEDPADGAQPPSRHSPGGASPAAPHAAPPAQAQADPAIVGALGAMGFERAKCERAAVATGNAGVEEAATWILTNGDEEAPALSGDAAAAPNEADVTTLVSFGFSERAAWNALIRTGGNVEAAADWILNDPQAAEAEAPPAAISSGDAPPTREATREAPQAAPPGNAPAATGAPLSDGPAQYELFALITHLGANTQCGHYVCHIKKEGSWILFNDSKVAVSENPPFDMGYLYFYRRFHPQGDDRT